MSRTERDQASSGFGADFSLVGGGPLYRLALRTRLVRDERELLRLGVAFALLTWVPLAVLAMIHGSPDGVPAVPFLLSVGTHVRFLVAIPLLFAAEAWIAPRMAVLVRQIVESRLVAAPDLPALDAAVRRAVRLRDSTLAEVVLVGLAVVLVMAGVRADLPADVTTWRATSAGTGVRLTPAGWWYTAVSLPVFQFLIGRWGWRLLIWSAFLWRLSRTKLRLTPTHPDLTGGLGLLGVTQRYFAPLTFAASAVLAASFGEQILFRGAKLQAFALPAASILLGNLVVFLGPLLFFTPRLWEAKLRGLEEYGVLAAGYTREFDAKWLRGEASPGEPLLGSADIQSLADLRNSFDVIREMRLVPFGLDLVLSVGVAAVSPMLPLLVLVFPLDELLLRLVKLLLGV